MASDEVKRPLQAMVEEVRGREGEREWARETWTITDDRQQAGNGTAFFCDLEVYLAVRVCLCACVCV